MKYYLAIDIGASSGRHILSYVKNEKIVLEEIYRFDNKQIRKNGHDCWDIEHLSQSIIKGIAKCKEINKIPFSIGIDTWAVDYILVNEEGMPVSDAVAYRDERTKNINIEHILPFDYHYQQTGIQHQPFNTVYQLSALQKESPNQLLDAYRMLMIPDYFNFLLTGKMVQEYTNATSTALVNAHTNDWDDEIIEKLGLPRKIFGEILMPGQTVGNFTEEIEKQVGFNSLVVLPCTHDTASAFLAVPAQTEDAVYISSGTWSLLGVENKLPITTTDSMKQNFTNEGGYEFRYRYLKNIMGLWMIQSIRRELNGISYISGKNSNVSHNLVVGDGIQYSFSDLEVLAREAKNFTSIIDVDDERFLSPQSMIKEVIELCKETKQPEPQTVGEIMQCVYISLAKKYKQTIENLQKLTNKTYTTIHIVGGGSQANYLNELCSSNTGLQVYAGPTEATALGNAIVQMIKANEFTNLNEARKAILKSQEIKEI